MEQEPNRRSFLGFLIFGLGAIFSAIIGVPIALYVIDPRHRKPPDSDLKLVDGIKLSELLPGGEPRQGVIRDTRLDAWTLYPSDVVGRVWVVQIGARPPNLATMSSTDLKGYNANAAARDAYLRVFTTICPHLGCSVNLNEAHSAFLCPCHAASFAFNGVRAPGANPAARDMDSLDWEIDPSDPERNRIAVRFKSFQATMPTKVET